ncbi:low molecular weight phosphotyrosine protein phosphatase [Pseudomonas sp. Choline-3u-10]|jgi:protein-tyrosine phosphatase|uniref:low molecular weight protein-tyrosine-phosphatase n=1 Tax=Pseudomonadaceae TaxID=135621 RepID=UPI000617FC86|nr:MULTISPECIES: low molecular weight protein-tyrosine-phosphatase [Pseudomonadaceae]MAL36623.1 low molecular weight phosphotyrosine protein phosphatase [Pseudomonas sp.]MBU0949692.1 low molecular weight phosphotyrosine protein phosphatase [Gammaproteobacteria bacterium]KJJ61436.1 phosphotyrosine protein phosphatase [Pseudomonas sp. 10B238]MBK3797090.1 low molecular weight phosphotyrosine protein phosphatase [Stutzerimonas stutzeri]MBK3877593.1 low molecular weight phosphotyrosine protein phos|tara:strand:+ start:1679 stop:2116 length:438 start_codon:yes stop_codon:yes gene_type:complete
MFQNILIVCVGNICRSPAAEALLAHKLEGKGLTISSAGIGALVGNPMDKTAHEVLNDHGVEHASHRARQVDSEMLHRADLILVMEQSHVQHIRQIAPEVHGKTFLLGKWLDDTEIPDPYRQSKPAFEHVHSLLTQSVESWLPYLK